MPRGEVGSVSGSTTEDHDKATYDGSLAHASPARRIGFYVDGGMPQHRYGTYLRPW